jgi:methyltransferase-like protein
MQNERSGEMKADHFKQNQEKKQIIRTFNQIKIDSMKSKFMKSQEA